MAELYRKITGSFDHLLDYLDDGILNSGVTISLKGAREFVSNGCRAAVRVYERYAFLGGNRMSLTLLLLQSDEDIEVYAVGSGGSQAAFFKINTWSEQGFVDDVARLLNDYEPD